MAYEGAAKHLGLSVDYVLAQERWERAGSPGHLVYEQKFRSYKALYGSVLLSAHFAMLDGCDE